MSQLRICRICVGTETKMFHLDNHNLKDIYQEVTSIQVNEDLPQFLCYECASLIYKFYKFKGKCYKGAQILRELFWSGQLNYEGVYEVDRKELKSPLEIMIVTKRVKTFVDKKKLTQQKLHINVDSKVTNENLITSSANEEIVPQIETDNVLVEAKSDIDKKTIIEDYAKEVAEINDSGTLQEDTQIKSESLSGDDDNNIVDQGESSSDDSDHLPLKLIMNKTKPNISALKTKLNVTKKESQTKRLKQTKYVPSNVIVDAKKEGVRPKKLRVKFERKKRLKKVTKEEEIILNSKNWVVETLNDEDAMKEFRCKPQDPKYVDAEYKCTDCFKSFSNADIMKRHRKMMHDECRNMFECRFCKMRYSRKSQLARHVTGHYNRYYCARCNFVCNSKNTAFLHDEYHSGLHRTCQHCGKQFRHSSSYYTHLRLSHKSEFVCSICGVSCISEAGLDMHKRKKHIDHEGPKESVEEAEVYCGKCDIHFETTKAFEKHFDGSANHPEKNRRRGHGKQKVFKKPCTCYQCGLSFETQADYFIHHKKVHPRTSAYEETIICEVCGAALKPGSVKAHINLHTKEQTFSCDTCGREFNSYVSLKRHFLTHTGEKPHQCTMCDKRFTQRGSMLLHYRTFHLKEPYPKRNRNRNKKVFIEMTAFQNTQEQK